MSVRGAQVAIFGGGAKGRGIAVLALRAGYATAIIDPDPSQVVEVTARIRLALDERVSSGALAASEADAALARLRVTSDPAECREAEFVIEAIGEELEAKRALLARLAGTCRPDAVFVSSTSCLSITAIAAGTGRPERTVGMHFCDPAPLTRLVEVTRGLQASEDAFLLARALAEKLGCVTVVTQDTPGLIRDFLLVALANDSIRAYEAGRASLEDIDAAVKLGLGHAMGPFELVDAIGLDTHLAVSTALYEELKDARFSSPPLVRRLVAAGRLGRSSGRGFYTYDADGKIRRG